MSSPNLSRISGLAAVVAGVTFIIAELFTPFVAPNLSEANRNVGTVAFTDAFFAQSLLTLFGGAVLLGGLVGLYARQSHVAGSLGAVGFLLAFFGTVLVTGDFYANTFVTPLLAIGNYEFLGGTRLPGRGFLEAHILHSHGPTPMSVPDSDRLPSGIKRFVAGR